MLSLVGIEDILHNQTCWFMATSLPFTTCLKSHADNDQWGANYILDTSKSYAFSLMCWGLWSPKAMYGVHSYYMHRLLSDPHLAVMWVLKPQLLHPFTYLASHFTLLEPLDTKLLQGSPFQVIHSTIRLVPCVTLYYKRIILGQGSCKRILIQRRGLQGEHVIKLFDDMLSVCRSRFMERNLHFGIWWWMSTKNYITP